MPVPPIQFPVEFDRIPAEVKRLSDVIKAANADIKIASEMLRLVRQGCEHKGAERGYNERDGSWMNACPHCGAVE